MASTHRALSDAMFDIDEEPAVPIPTSPITLNPTSKMVTGSHLPTSFASLVPNPSSPTGPRSLPKPSALALSLQQNEISPIRSPPPASSPQRPDLANRELMRMHAGQTPTHRSAWAKGYYHPPEADSDSGSEEEEEEEADEDEAEEEIMLTFLPGTSVPINVPSMRPPPKVADDSFQVAMSRSIDPGPTLDLDPRHGPRKAPVEGDADDDDDDDDEANHRAKVAMQPGRGSLHAQRILEREVPDPPASMWRSLA